MRSDSTKSRIVVMVVKIGQYPILGSFPPVPLDFENCVTPAEEVFRVSAATWGNSALSSGRGHVRFQRKVLSCLP